jgi:hypothetical protein
MKEEPTLAEKLALVSSAEEMDGFRGQLQRDGRLDARAQNLIAMRLAEIGRRK